jgi:hypothetical protein
LAKLKLNLCYLTKNAAACKLGLSDGAQLIVHDPVALGGLGACAVGLLAGIVALALEDSIHLGLDFTLDALKMLSQETTLLSEEVREQAGDLLHYCVAELVHLTFNGFGADALIPKYGGDEAGDEGEEHHQQQCTANAGLRITS